MATARKRGEKTRYDVRCRRCLGYKCFAPVRYTHRGATSSGSMNSGESYLCMTRAYHGCPEHPEYSEALRRKRLAEGWRAS